MAVLSFSVLCGHCEESLQPREAWRADDREHTTRMSWYCETCDAQICIQMTEEGDD